MNKDQQFVLEKIRYGLSSKNINQPITDKDLERLNWPADDYKKIPEVEWNEWSRITHWALQIAFLDDTSTMKDKGKITEWRKRFMNVAQSSLSKPNDERIVLESAAFHFLEKDLLQHAYDIFGYKNLTEEEQKMIDVFSGAAKLGRSKGCLGTVLLSISILILLSVVIVMII